MALDQPRSGARDGHAPLLMGGGKDRPIRDPSSRYRSLATHRLLLRLRDRFFPELRGQPQSAEWIGTMAFTTDQLPALGDFVPDSSIVEALERGLHIPGAAIEDPEPAELAAELQSGLGDDDV